MQSEQVENKCWMWCQLHKAVVTRFGNIQYNWSFEALLLNRHFLCIFSSVFTEKTKHVKKSTFKENINFTKQKDFSLNKQTNNKYVKKKFMIWEVYTGLQHSTSKTGLCYICLHFFFSFPSFLLGNRREIFFIGQCRLPRSRIKNPFLCQKEGSHHSITKYCYCIEVMGQKNAKTDFRFSMPKFIQSYSWMCNTMALLFVRQQQTIDLAN